MKKENESLNYVELATLLRNKADKYCKRYKEDIEADLAAIYNVYSSQKEKNENGKHTFFVGFRELGVDGIFYMKGRLNCPSCYGDFEGIYKEIDVIELNISHGIGEFHVKRYFRNHYNIVEKLLRKGGNIE